MRDKKGRFLPTANNEGRTRLYNCWNHMRHRVRKDCKHKFTHLYFERGIDLCKEWEDYFVFKDWALKNGYMDNLEIDRKNNDLGYHPDNCRWVSRTINCNNRTTTRYIDYDGEKQPLSIVLAKKGILHKYDTIFARIKRGINHQEAIDRPIQKGNYSKSNFKNKTKGVKENLLKNIT